MLTLSQGRNNKTTMQKDMKITINITKNGYCDVEIEEGKRISALGTRTPMQLLGLLFSSVITDTKLKKKIDNWITRIDGDHAEIIDELVYEKFEEVADIATRVRESFYK